MMVTLLDDSFLTHEHETVVRCYQKTPFEQVTWDHLNKVISVTNELEPPLADSDRQVQIFYYAKVKDDFLGYVKDCVIATWMQALLDSQGWDSTFLAHPMAGVKRGRLPMAVAPEGFALSAVQCDQAFELHLNPIKYVYGCTSVCLWGNELFRNGKWVKNNGFEAAQANYSNVRLDYACLGAVFPNLLDS
jgi:hypothetical protein